MRRLILAASLCLIAASASAQPKPSANTMQMDSDHSNVTATVAGAKGRFGTVAGALQYDPAKPDSSTLLLSLDASSIQNDAVRTAFDAERYPELRIASTDISKHGAMPTDVSIRDITKPIIFQVSYKVVSRDVVAFHAEATIRSADFHLNGKGDVPIVIDAPFNRITPTQALP